MDMGVDKTRDHKQATHVPACRVTNGVAVQQTLDSAVLDFHGIKIAMQVGGDAIPDMEVIEYHREISPVGWGSRDLQDLNRTYSCSYSPWVWANPYLKKT